MAVAAVLLLGACTANDSQPSGVVAATVPAPGSLSLLVEPEQGFAPLYALLRAAQRSIDLTMYEFVDPTSLQLLEAAAARGVDVRVILDANREKTANAATYRQLREHGVHAVWADAGYAATHQKTVVIDRAVAAVMTLNLTSRYYGDTRDFAVLDRQPADVDAIGRVFDADFSHHHVRPARAGDLVWSPGAEPALLHVIRSASSTLLVENEEMALRAAKTALEQAARAGVHVTVVMTERSDWDADFAELQRAGVDVEVLSSNAALYIHAKAIVADASLPGRQAFVGSQNFSAASLDHNRELGLVTADPGIVGGLAATIAGDAAAAHPWHA